MFRTEDEIKAAIANAEKLTKAELINLLGEMANSHIEAIAKKRGGRVTTDKTEQTRAIKLIKEAVAVSGYVANRTRKEDSKESNTVIKVYDNKKYIAYFRCGVSSVQVLVKTPEQLPDGIQYDMICYGLPVSVKANYNTEEFKDIVKHILGLEEEDWATAEEAVAMEATVEQQESVEQ